MNSSESIDVAGIEAQAESLLGDLASVPDIEAFQALLRLQAKIGESLGESARTLAENGSWAAVAQVAGTSRQAAWQRWSAK
ncbi:hypothetical protein [Neomicrococcus aestuarii]|uniref:Uncharacterized protein n=1 Tax=Neomicrococcus aestuarii TaxID=556325 RepID=A0A1L2ZP47_9MICC|nr:hypothetical protein [Neomicrococcus aestuarii]APF40950.1 hypothetical protein BHE16_07975 [Neomicrococcus aestuarii]MBB5512752.1 hypothetical protein [Neomicrococcus aestuarii]